MRWVLLALAFAAGPPTAGTIAPGRGVAHLQLGMTRGAAIELLGTPSRVSGRTLAWSDPKRAVEWEVRAGDAGGRLDKIQLAVGRSARYPFCTAGGTCLGAADGLAKLRAEFGAQLEKTTQLGREAYLVRGVGYRGYEAYTVFVLRGSGGRIANVAFGYCAGTTLC